MQPIFKWISYYSWQHSFDIDMKDNLAYLADSEDGLYIINISNPDNPNPDWTL